MEQKAELTRKTAREAYMRHCIGDLTGEIERHTRGWRKKQNMP